jgi:hypothetical protein
MDLLRTVVDRDPRQQGVGRYSGIQIPKNQNPQLLKSGLKIGVTQLPL